MELSYRAKQILYAVISEFVATGEPVGSRTLSKKAGIDLSPASIRNVLADLDELGYLVQPHTSAGRVPTDKAFRLFIDALMHVQQLSAQEHARIRAHIDVVAQAPGRDVIRETGKLLSELTGTAAVVVAPRTEAATLRTLRFVARRTRAPRSARHVERHRAKSFRRRDGHRIESSSRSTTCSTTSSKGARCASSVISSRAGSRRSACARTRCASARSSSARQRSRASRRSKASSSSKAKRSCSSNPSSKTRKA